MTKAHPTQLKLVLYDPLFEHIHLLICLPGILSEGSGQPRVVQWNCHFDTDASIFLEETGGQLDNSWQSNNDYGSCKLWTMKNICNEIDWLVLIIYYMLYMNTCCDCYINSHTNWKLSRFISLIQCFFFVQEVQNKMSYTLETTVPTYIPMTYGIGYMIVYNFKPHWIASFKQHQLKFINKFISIHDEWTMSYSVQECTWRDQFYFPKLLYFL